jgi:hypothetical protein
VSALTDLSYNNIVQFPYIISLLMYEITLFVYPWSEVVHMCEPTCGFIGCL